MNTVKSVYYGWATLIAAGGGAYYFAKKSINADRAQKAEAERAKRARLYALEESHGLHGGAAANPRVGVNKVVGGEGKADTVVREELGGQREASPSVEAGRDPAATGHAGEGKYEASAVFRSRKGDRFS